MDTSAFFFATPGETLSSSAISAVFGQDIKLREDRLESFAFRRLNPVQIDLVFIALSVAYADRFPRRQHEGGWARHLHLSIPTFAHSVWVSSAVTNALEETLQYLTGDNWNFEFRARSDWGKHQYGKIGFLNYDEKESAVIPYSNGLDSFAANRLLAADFPDLGMIRLTAWNKGLSVTHNPAGPRDWAAIPVRLPALNHGEISFRTRSFLYLVLAGVAAQSLGSQLVLIPENGQGAVGPTLVSIGAEWPGRGSFPGFTARLANLLRLATDISVSFKHPFIGSTKGQMLERLVQGQLATGWQETRSCARDSRRSSANKSRAHCGICSGCMLRRAALSVAGLQERRQYLWHEIDAENPADIKSIKGDVPSKGDLDLMVNSGIAMERLAQFGSRPSDRGTLVSIGRELEGVCPTYSEGGAAFISRLLASHRREWDAFLEAFSSNSWLRNLRDVL